MKERKERKKETKIPYKEKVWSGTKELQICASYKF